MPETEEANVDDRYWRHDNMLQSMGSIFTVFKALLVKPTKIMCKYCVLKITSTTE